MEAEPMISIITVTKNSARYLPECIDSISRQTYSRLEHVIIDGLSTDDTMDILEQYKESASYIVKLFSEADNGIYDAMNKGIYHSEGDIIGILNSDDYYEDDALKIVVANIGSYNYLHGNMRFVNEKGQAIKVYGHKKGSVRKFITTPYNHPTMFLKKEAYEVLGKFDDSFQVAGDYEFMLRVERSNLKDIYVDKVLTNYRTVGKTSFTNDVVGSEEIVRALTQNGVPTIAANFFVNYRVKRSFLHNKVKKYSWLLNLYRWFSPYHKNLG